MAQGRQGQIRILPALTSLSLKQGGTTGTPGDEGVSLASMGGASAFTPYGCQGEERVPGDCDIIFPQTVYRQVVEHLKEDMSREHGGFLLGYELCAGESQIPTVYVDQAVRAKYTEGTPVRLTFTEATWRDLDEFTDKLRQLGRVPRRVGWYHSHPNIQIFLSRWDLDVCKTFDERRHPIALVVDPVNDKGGFFVRGKAGYRPHSPQGFVEMHDLQKECAVAWINMSRVEGSDVRPSEQREQERQREEMIRIDRTGGSRQVDVERTLNQTHRELQAARRDASSALRRSNWLTALVSLSVLATGYLGFHTWQLGNKVENIHYGAYESGLVRLVKVEPERFSLGASQTKALVARVNDGSGIKVNWEVENPEDGTVSKEGLYTAPHTISKQRSVTIKAISVADPKKAGIATVTLMPLPLSVTPHSATLTASKSAMFQASAAGSSRTGVKWSVSPDRGKISPSGEYTAPSSISARETVTITAQSEADPSMSATAIVTLEPAAKPTKEVSVSVIPDSANLDPSHPQQQFKAAVTGTSNQAVTWRVKPPKRGAIKDGLYTAPKSIPTVEIVTVTASSKADPKVSGTATVTLNPSPAQVSVSVNPKEAMLSAKKTQKFAAVGGGEKGITWSIDPPGVGSISPDGEYKAPDSIVERKTVKVRAVSKADPKKVGAAEVTLTPPMSVNVTPDKATLSVKGTQKFEAHVTGGNPQVTWSIDPLDGSSSPDLVGSISTVGDYTAPTSIKEVKTVKVRAVSEADATQSNVAIVTLQPAASDVAVEVSPDHATVGAGETQKFTVNVTGTSDSKVTWLLVEGEGNIDNQTGEYTAPPDVKTSKTVTVKAISQADRTSSGTATVTLKPSEKPSDGTSEH